MTIAERPSKTTRTPSGSKGRRRAPATRGGAGRRPPRQAERRTRGYHVIRWIEAHCVHTNGEWIGRPFRLLGWQKRLLLELFELEPDAERPGEWVRRYRWALIGMPKKNGKTELAAALALYLLIGDEEPAPKIACAAGSDDQADLVFGACRTMVEMSPTLRQVALAYEREIQVPSIPGAVLKRVAAVAGTNDGQNLHAVICDELHEWSGGKGEQTWNVLTGGGGTRRQPMIIQITTAGFDKESICGKQYELGRGIERGEITDPRYFFRWIEAPREADYRAEETWRLANPSWGILVRPSFLGDQLTKKTEAVFRRYYLNQWTDAEEAVFPVGTWDRCAAPELELDPAYPAYVAIDIGLRHDASAITIAQRRPVGRHDDGTERHRTITRTRIWTNPYPERDKRHSEWTVPLAELENYLREIADRYPVPAATNDADETVPGPAFEYDPRYFARSAELLEGEGLNMIETPQTDARMVPASMELFRLVMTGDLAHEGSPSVAAHVANTIQHHKPRGWRFSKPTGSRKRIDAVITNAMAAYSAQAEPPPPPRRRRFASW